MLTVDIHTLCVVINLSIYIISIFCTDLVSKLFIKMLETNTEAESEGHV